ncbi:Uncharacterized conserved protein, contains N-recognin-type Zn-finger [Phaffia rhodozyma]|uniref:Uncharacterized conserved protein, contains N-recognin-type Zn-finger n=1 Tax=Phaffia rhodozyma TaxID=264483 RepID=A0A0F7SHD0_PHARH|nr:Uncharacterized conserved protein, contains N-recognin-type Zn-finger [Phaffia rhodozyma]
MTPSQPAPILQPTLFQTLDPSQTYSLSSLLQRQAELNDEAAEVLKGDIGKAWTEEAFVLGVQSVVIPTMTLWNYSKRDLYDPEREVETMVQCLVCEDWYHESHLNLLASTSPTSSSDLSTGAGPETDQDQEPILSEDAYDHLICERCVLARPVLRDYLGRDGFPCLVRSEEGSGWTVEGLLEFDDGEEDEGEEGEGEGDGGEKNSAPEKDGTAEAKETKPSDEPAKVINSTGLGKRPLSPSPSALSPSKKRKTTCTYPTTSRSSALGALITRREAVYLSREKTGKVETVHDSEWKDGRADMFVQDGFRDRWCVCDIHKHQFKQLPFLLKEEQSWPPSSQEDETEGSSSAIPSADSAEAQDILLSNLLQALPRGKTLDAITAFNELSADLITFFRTRTAERRALALADGSGIGEESVISERDIKEFFEDFLQKKQRSRRT